MARKSARAAAVQMVYENMLGGDGGEETLRGLIEFTPEEGDEEYISSLVQGVEEHAGELDADIEKCLKGWTLDRISRVDLCILRVALCEMKHMALPPAVAINEALELARAYSTPEAVTFINGVLGNIARETQA